jgi:hypothetical protein
MDGPQECQDEEQCVASGRMIVHMVALAAARQPTAVRLKESQTFRESANVPMRMRVPPTQSDPNQKEFRHRH